MKKKIFLLLCFIVISSGFCFEFRNKDSVTVGLNEVIDDDLILMGNDIIINGVVNGDVIVMGNNVDLSGVVNGDLISAASYVSISGVVSDDVIVGAGTIIISGTVQDDILAGAGQLNLQETSLVNSSVSAGAGRVNIAGIINGNLTVKTSDLTIADSALILGNVNYTSENQATISDNADIGGMVAYTQSESYEKDYNFKSMLAQFLMSVLATIVSGLGVIYLAKNFLKKYYKKVGKESASLGFYGLLTIIVIPIIGIILVFTGFGSPVGMIILALYGISLYLNWVFLCFNSGRVLTKWLKLKIKKNKDLWNLVIGSLSLGVLALIPFIGAFMIIVLGLISYGALIYLKKEAWQDCSKKKIV